jgi:alpha-tubulin suppressor-like RCC1 family protein
MAFNLQKLELELAKKINSEITPYEAAVYAKALKFLKQSPINVVGMFSSLPSASSVEDGTLYLVESDAIVYVADSSYIGVGWRLVQSDLISQAWAWGSGIQGRLGDGTIVNKSSPVSVVGGFTDWCQLSAGGSHSAAVRQNGTIWAWGCNGQGQLGDGTTVTNSSPVSVIGGFTDWCQVSAVTSNTAAIRQNGTLWGWGANLQGQLGDGTTISKSSPVSVIGGFTDWCQISVGSGPTAAVRQNGTLWTWGSNICGRLGDGTTVNRSSPVSVVGGFTDWCQVSVGYCHIAAVRQNGTLWAWGYNGQGRLGDGTTIDKSSPVSVVGGFTDWCQVSGGPLHTAAVRQNGTLWAWGYNGGRLGDGTTVNKSSPVSVIGGFTDWCQVSSSSHTAAVRQNGTLWTWGANSNGRLGDGTTVDKSSPVSVVGGFTDWCQVSAGAAHTAAIKLSSC